MQLASKSSGASIHCSRIADGMFLNFAQTLCKGLGAPDDADDGRVQAGSEA